ncbi:hypothetical protein ACIQZI_12780 [Peribacillus sp. NPDC096379]|uniref:hypothetical protein n=1 Tax=Peribacillus sp. NPDC096379 TaxID=3364393 RepID=UPI00381025CD
MYNAFEKAITLHKVEKNPCVSVTIKGELKDQEIKFIESEHISDFLREAYNYDYIYWFFYKTLIETGMRKGEAAALQWTDVDFQNNAINTNKSLDFKEAPKGDPDTMFGDTKTYKFETHHHN